MAFVRQWIQSCRPFESSEPHFAPDPSCLSNTSGAAAVVQSQQISQLPRDYEQATQQTGDMFSTFSVSDYPPLIDNPAYSNLPSDSTLAALVGQPGREYQQSMAPTFWYSLNSSYQHHHFADLPPTTATVNPTAIATTPSATDNSLSPWPSSLMVPQSATKDSVLDHQPQQSQHSPLPPQTHQKFETTSYQQGLDPLSALVDPWTQFYHQAIVSPSLSSSSSATSMSSSSSSTASCIGSSSPIVHFSVAAVPNPAVVYPDTSYMTRASAEANCFEFSYPLPQSSYTSAPPSFSLTPSSSYCHPPMAMSGVLTAPMAQKFTPRASSILTRRQSSALALKNPVHPLHNSQSSALLTISSKAVDSTIAITTTASTFHRRSSGSASSSSPLLSSTTTTCSSTLTCQVCKKRYANNSTLRRHLKIHAYANSTNRSLSLLRSAGHGGGGGGGDCGGSGDSPVSRAARHLLSVQPSRGSGSSSSSPFTAMVPFKGDVGPHGQTLSSPLPIQGIGYSPGSDPDIKKPECVGCNKAFARRDTVILHIKNKKRKWDLLNAMLPVLTSGSPDASSVATASISMAMMGGGPGVIIVSGGGGGGNGGGGGGGGRRVQRQRKSHPYRMVEKLWQSTLQKKGLLLTASPSSSTRLATTASSASNSRLSPESRYESIEGVKLESSDLGLYPVALGGRGVDNDNNKVEENERDDDDDTALGGEEESIGEDGWPSLETMSRMDSQIKLRWMMKMMVMPPCWTERKVRLFGAFGVMEEKVLQ